MNEHVFDGPDEYLGRIDALMESAQIPAEFCPHCRVATELIPGAGSRWLIGITHERACPEFTE